MNKNDFLNKINVSDVSHVSNQLDKIVDGISTQKLGHGGFIDKCLLNDWAGATAKADEVNSKYMNLYYKFVGDLKWKNQAILPITWLVGVEVFKISGASIIRAVQNELKSRNYFTRSNWETDNVLIIQSYFPQEELDLEEGFETLVKITNILDEVGVESEVIRKGNNIVELIIYQK